MVASKVLHVAAMALLAGFTAAASISERQQECNVHANDCPGSLTCNWVLTSEEIINGDLAPDRPGVCQLGWMGKRDAQACSLDNNNCPEGQLCFWSLQPGDLPGPLPPNRPGHCEESELAKREVDIATRGKSCSLRNNNCPEGQLCMIDVGPGEYLGNISPTRPGECGESELAKRGDVVSADDIKRDLLARTQLCFAPGREGCDEHFTCVMYGSYGMCTPADL